MLVMRGYVRKTAQLAAAAHGLRRRHASQVAVMLGVSERTIHRYWRRTMVTSSFMPAIPDAPPELEPGQYEVIAHCIAAWAPDVPAALEVAAALEVPMSAFADALSAIRVTRYAAPAAELFTVLHIVERGLAPEGFAATACGRVLFPDQLWQFLEVSDGDPVCPACQAGHAEAEQLAIW